MTPSRSELSPELVALIEANLDRVQIIAHRFKRRLPAFVEFDELVSCGNLRLVECAYRYDPAKSAFSTFADRNIKGAMYDFLRQCDLMTRHERTSLRNDGPLRREIPVEAVLNLGRIDRAFEEVTARADVRKLVTVLPERLAYIVNELLNERTQKEIGDELQICESRASQLTTRAIALMRAAA
jgi:RNA polymerase sigma factor (sigma-70 family)